MMKYQFVIFAMLLASNCMGQSIAHEIDSVYHFKPSTLSVPEKDFKSHGLDEYWNRVKADSVRYIPLLRTELKASGHNPYFYADGSRLLLSLTDNKADRELAIESMAKCDLDDISPTWYVQTLSRWSRQGFDVLKPALKILTKEDFGFYIPQHSFSFTKGYCLAYMLLPQIGTEWIDTLQSVFNGLSASSQKAVITTLWYAHTCKGDTLLASIRADNTLDSAVSVYAQKIIGYTKIPPEALTFYDLSTPAKVADLRAKALTSFSDEAIYDLDLTTRLMRRDEKCR